MDLRLCTVWEGSLWIHPFPVTKKEKFKEYETNHCDGGSGLRKIKSLLNTSLLSFWLSNCAILGKSFRFYL